MENLNKESPPSAPPATATEAPQIVSRLKGETSRAYAYAWKYITMGRGRSIEKVSAEVHITARQLERCSTKWRWVKRAADYDTWLEDKNREAMDLFATQDAAKWAARERDRREKRWERGEKNGAAGDLILGFPLTEVKRVVETDTEGRATVYQIIKPVRFVKRDAIHFHKRWEEMTGAAIANEGAQYSQTDVQNVIDDADITPYVSAGAKEKT